MTIAEVLIRSALVPAERTQRGNPASAIFSPHRLFHSRPHPQGQ